MYYLRMAEEEIGIIAERLERAMTTRKLKAVDLARLSGVDKSTISVILANQRPNTPAHIIAKLAKGLMVSADYLVGLADEMEPKGIQLSETLIELIQVTGQLTDRRQRELVEAAHAYLQARRQMRKNPEILMDKLLDMIEEAGGKVSRDQLLDSLNLDFDDPDQDDE